MLTKGALYESLDTHLAQDIEASRKTTLGKRP